MFVYVREGIRVRATVFTYRSASWTRPSTWLSEARENRCTSSMPDRMVSSDNFYYYQRHFKFWALVKDH